MKRLLFIFVTLMMSVNIWSQVIKQPDNHKYGVYYMNDSSVVFNTDGLKFSVDDIPSLISIFIMADKLNNYCQTHVNIEVKKLIDSIGDYKFIYGYNPDSKLSAIAIYQHEPCNIYIYNFNKIKFLDYLLKYRNEYYTSLKMYNDELNKIEVILNAIM